MEHFYRLFFLQESIEFILNRSNNSIEYIDTLWIMHGHISSDRITTEYYYTILLAKVAEALCRVFLAIFINVEQRRVVSFRVQ